MATLDDIARQLGVAKSTVSKALNGADDVSENMRRAVLEKAVELGYSRALRGAQPRIAVFVTNMDYANPEDFGYDIVIGFRKLAEPAGYHVEIIPLDIPTQKNMHYDEYMILGNYRGGLFLGLSLLDPWLKDFQTCRTPTVLYDNKVEGNPHVTYVGVDNFEGMEQVVEYLKGLGHEKIGYFTGGLESYITQKRCRAFFRAAEKNGLPCGEELMGNNYHVTKCMDEHLDRLLDLGCTAFVCSHDLMAKTVIESCAKRGLKVPEDISVMGHDDGPLCELTTPALSSVRQNRTELGKSAFYALSSQMGNVHLSILLLHTELIVRDSCGPAPKK
ncbi:MAG: LacI family DNA-binding transcriptional regulator [Oscillospiraceae bacterium]|nr:LacI family DNA-binding transcriptional regulator [Oscillospiraceae bacterium]